MRTIKQILFWLAFIIFVVCGGVSFSGDDEEETFDNNQIAVAEEKTNGNNPRMVQLQSTVKANNNAQTNNQATGQKNIKSKAGVQQAVGHQNGQNNDNHQSTGQQNGQNNNNQPVANSQNNQLPNNQQVANQKNTANASGNQPNSQNEAEIFVDDEGYMYLMQDFSGILSDNDFNKLEQKLEEISDKHNIWMGVLTTEGLPGGYDIGRVATEFLNDNYVEDGSVGAIIMVVDTKNRKWHVTYDDKMKRICSNECGFPYLQDRFLSKLKDDDYAGAFGEYADGVDFLCNYYEKNQEAYDPDNEFSWGGLGIAVVLSLGIGYLFAEHLRSKMSNVTPASSADDYLNHGSVDISNRNDVYLYTSVTRVHHDSDSSSGGSGGGGGNGGGGSY